MVIVYPGDTPHSKRHLESALWGGYKVAHPGGLAGAPEVLGRPRGGWAWVPARQAGHVLLPPGPTQNGQRDHGAQNRAGD